jgi:hypothetical protein
MIAEENEPSDANSSKNIVALYREAFLAKCHHLILMGYSKMNASAFRVAEETAITGELVKEIAAILESDEAPEWADRFDVHDDPPQNAPGRQGKRRRRVDIAFLFVQRGVRPRLLFEAKRLHDSGCVAAYLGADGLGMYVSGEYAPHDPGAGMLGYVQSGTIKEWSAKLGEAMDRNRRKYRMTTDGDLCSNPLVVGIETSRSRHERAKGTPIAVYHSFLLFQ